MARVMVSFLVWRYCRFPWLTVHHVTLSIVDTCLMLVEPDYHNGLRTPSVRVDTCLV